MCHFSSAGEKATLAVVSWFNSTLGIPLLALPSFLHATVLEGQQVNLKYTYSA